MDHTQINDMSGIASGLLPPNVIGIPLITEGRGGGSALGSHVGSGLISTPREIIKPPPCPGKRRTGSWGTAPHQGRGRLSPGSGARRFRALVFMQRERRRALRRPPVVQPACQSRSSSRAQVLSLGEFGSQEALSEPSPPPACLLLCLFPKNA